MLFISHIYTATRLQKQLKIQRGDVYCFASVLPDIRYVTNLERKRTHVQLESLQKYFRSDSDLYKGYYLHLLIDEYMGQWGFHERLRAQYPKMLQSLLKPILLNVILELYAWEHLNKTHRIRLNATYFPEYRKFGMKQAEVERYASYIQAMLDDFSIETATQVILSDPKLADNKKVAKYKQIGSLILNFAPLKWYLLGKVHHIYNLFVKDLERRIVSDIFT